MNGGHPSFDLRSEFSPAQVNIQKRRLNTSVTGKQGNFVDIPPTPGQIGKAEMPRGMGGKLPHPSTFCHAFHHFRPGPDRDGSSEIPI